MTILMTRLRWEFLGRRRRSKFPAAPRPCLEEPRRRPGAVGLGARRELRASAAAAAGRRQDGGRVPLNVDGGETFAEDRVVGLEVNV